MVEELTALSSLYWKRQIGKYFSFIQHHRYRKIVLIYHAIGNSSWALPVEKFKQQMQWLKQHVKVVSFSDLIEKTFDNNAIEVTLTFDDGYGCLIDYVLP